MTSSTTEPRVAAGPSTAGLGDWGISLTATVTVSFACAILFPDLRHWFLFPVTACGVVIGTDAVRWLRGMFDVFDPRGLLGAYGVHFFYIAPILVILTDYHTPNTASTLYDYRPYLGLMAGLNLVGLLMYQVAARWAVRRPYKATIKVWRLEESRAFVVLLGAIAVASVAQLYLFARFGLIGRLEWGEEHEVLAGTGFIRLAAQSLPVLLLFLVTLMRGRTGWRRTTVIGVGTLLAVLVGWQFLTTGLMGSRSDVVFPLFVAAGVVHFFWRPFTSKEAIMGVLVVVAFMYLYSFYKWHGVEAIKQIQTQGVAATASQTGVRLQGTLIGDLSRADVQAYTAFVMLEKPYPYEYRMGKTVIGDTLVHFPRWIWPNKYNLRGSSAKQAAGTDIIRGPGFYDPYRRWRKATRVFGMSGYTMLNFGVWAAPLPFLGLGLLVGFLQRAIAQWRCLMDMRLLLAPVLTVICLVILTGDLDNNFRFVYGVLAVPAVLVWLISTRQYWSAQAGTR